MTLLGPVRLFWLISDVVMYLAYTAQAIVLFMTRLFLPDRAATLSLRAAAGTSSTPMDRPSEVVVLHVDVCFHHRYPLLQHN